MYLRAIRMWGCLRHVPRHRVLGIVTAFLLHASLRCRRRGAVASGWLYNCQTRTRCFVRRTLRGGALPCTRRWSRTDLRTTAHRRCKIRIHRGRSSRSLPQRQASRRGDERRRSKVMSLSAVCRGYPPRRDPSILHCSPTSTTASRKSHSSCEARRCRFGPAGRCRCKSLAHLRSRCRSR